MEPQGRGNVPALQAPERNKRLGLSKTTLESRVHVQTSWAECRDKKSFGTEPKGKIFLLTFPFIGPLPRVRPGAAAGDGRRQRIDYPVANMGTTAQLPRRE